MALCTHQVGFFGKFERGWVCWGVGAVNFVAVATSHAAFTVALGAHQRFNNKSGLAKSSVLIKSQVREFIIGAALVTLEEFSLRGVIQLPVRARLTHGRLHVTLRTDGEKIPSVDFIEIHRRV